MFLRRVWRVWERGWDILPWWKERCREQWCRGRVGRTWLGRRGRYMRGLGSRNRTIVGWSSRRGRSIVEDGWMFQRVIGWFGAGRGRLEKWRIRFGWGCGGGLFLNVAIAMMMVGFLFRPWLFQFQCEKGFILVVGLALLLNMKESWLIG